MRRSTYNLSAIIFVFFFSMVAANAHFGMLIPLKQMILPGDNTKITLQLMFAHPFELRGMNLDKPARFGVVADNREEDLISTLKPAVKMAGKAWQTTYNLQRPGVYIFYMEPKPYWEPAEDNYIIHYTKVIVSAFGLDEGWDKEIGLRTEIVPLTRPYGLYAGNVFQGIVKVKGKPAPFTKVEVEYFNGSHEKKYTAPNDYMVTQVVKTDKNGVFTYAAPKAGWWGFAALSIDDKKIKGKDVEIGAILWVYFYEMK